MQISVIVPVYNVEDKLERCLNSILNQSFADFELILIDDGSTDGSPLICNKYASQDSRIKVIRQENSGASIARNKGLTLAKGKYIAFIDSDDFVEKDYLKVMYDLAEEKNSQLVISGVKWCAEWDVTVGTAQINSGDYCVELNKSNSSRIAKLIDERRFNYIYGKLYLQEIINLRNIKFREDIRIGEDTVFVMQYLSQITSCDIIGEAFYNYVKYNNGTLSSSYFNNQYQQTTLINNEIYDSLVKLDILNEDIQLVIDRRRLISAYWSIDAIRKNNISKKQKIDCIANIVNTKELVDACKETWDKKSDLPYADQIKSRKSKKILSKMNCDEKKQKLISKIKLFVYKITPAFIKKWRRKCKNNVQ